MSVYACNRCDYPIAEVADLECVCCPRCKASCAAHSATEVERLREALLSAQQQNERYKKSIAITDKNFRRMQARHDRYRDALVSIEGLSADFDEQTLTIINAEASAAIKGEPCSHPFHMNAGLITACPECGVGEDKL